MKKKDIVAAIYADLGNVLLPRGFKLKKSDEEFARQIATGEQSISVALVDLSPSFLFSVTIGIRIDEVEKIFHLFSGAPAEFHSMSTTTLTQLDYFADNELKEYSVSTREEVTSATTNLCGIFIETVFPFLDRCVDINSLHAELCIHPNLDSTRPPSGLMHALILSRLAKSDCFNELSRRCQDEVAAFPPLERDKVHHLIEYLNSLDGLK